MRVPGGKGGLDAEQNRRDLELKKLYRLARTRNQPDPRRTQSQNAKSVHGDRKLLADDRNDYHLLGRLNIHSAEEESTRLVPVITAATNSAPSCKIIVPTEEGVEYTRRGFHIRRELPRSR